VQALLVATQPAPQGQRNRHVERWRHKARGRGVHFYPQQRPQEKGHGGNHGQDQHDQKAVLKFEVLLALLELDGTKMNFLKGDMAIGPTRSGPGLVCKRMLASRVQTAHLL